MSIELIVWFSWSYSYLFLLSRGISTMTFTVSMGRLLINRAQIVLFRSRQSYSPPIPTSLGEPNRPDVDFAGAEPLLRQTRRLEWKRIGVWAVADGSGIAEICARAGADVVVIERDADALAQDKPASSGPLIGLHPRQVARG